MSSPRVQIVHERFTELAGSERVVEQMHAIWPDAVVHAPLVDRSAVPTGMATATVSAGPLQRFYRGGSTYAHLLPALPLAMNRIDTSGAEVIVASHHAFANRVGRRPGVPLVSYTHTPARWMWEPSFLANEVGGRLGRSVLSAFARSQRRADAAAARRAQLILVNSRHVAARVRRYWHCHAEVVHPPVDVHRYTVDPSVDREPFFLLAGRLVPYKRPEVAVAAAVRAGVRLVVAGDGRMRAAVEAASGPGVELLGHVDDDTLLELYRRCCAVVLPGEEDFGLVPVEAQACGTPVLAQAVGGALDSVVEGVTGTLYGISRERDHVDGLAAALRAFDPSAFDSAAIRQNAERFSRAAFREQLASKVDAVVALAATDAARGRESTARPATITP